MLDEALCLTYHLYWKLEGGRYFGQCSSVRVFECSTVRLVRLLKNWLTFQHDSNQLWAVTVTVTVTLSKV
jgi:hypothetical protein